MLDFEQLDISILVSLVAASASIVVAMMAFIMSQRNRRDLEVAMLRQNQITEGDGQHLSSALEKCRGRIMIVEPGLPALLEFQDEYLRLAREGVKVRILVTEVSDTELSSRTSEIKAAFRKRYKLLRAMVEKSDGQIFVRAQANRVQSPIVLIDGSLFVFPFHNFFNYSSLNVSGSPMFCIDDLEQTERFYRAFEERWETSDRPRFLTSND